MVLSRSSAWVSLWLFLAAAAPAADTAPIRRNTPEVHHSACALGESMADKVGTVRLTHEAAQRSCQALVPTMNAADHAEFMRCCIKRLVAGAPGGKLEKAHPPADGTQRM
jgi:hypothetical protein